ncbi:MAG: hypothetical protein ACD_79C00007G0001 [uncultured bacterium]|nr:MAG: hypothetical protein ACD_79C00007G0001 [uncultured bacterium]
MKLSFTLTLLKIVLSIKSNREITSSFIKVLTTDKVRGVFEAKWATFFRILSLVSLLNLNPGVLIFTTK